MTPQTIDQTSATRIPGLAPAEGVNATATLVQRNQVKYLPAGTGPAYWGPGDQITFLITGEQTGGAFFMAEVSVSPGGGPPPHIHRREEETFYLQQGSLTIQVGGETLQAAPGDFVYLPRGIMHCFKNTGNVDAKRFIPLRIRPRCRHWSPKRCWIGSSRPPPGTAWSLLLRRSSLDGLR